MKLLHWKLSVLMYLVSLALAAIAETSAHADDNTEPDFTPGAEIEIQAGFDEAIRIRRFDHQEAGIEIDGHLDEAVWADLPVLDQFKVIEPDTLATPPYRTEFRIFYTEKGVYASHNVEQPRDTILKRFMVRDDFDVQR